MPVSWKELSDAFEFVSAAGGDGQAFLCKESGAIYWRSELIEEQEELPDDLDDSEKYIELPDKRDLALGKPLVLDFARQILPNDFEDIRDIFSRSGAYQRFKRLLERRDALDAWYDFEAKAQKKALRDWCEAYSIEVIDD